MPVRFVTLFAALFCLLATSAAGAAPSIPREAADQLVSQPEAFREWKTTIAPPPDEAPVIALEEDKDLPAEDGPSFALRTIYFEGNTLVPETEFGRYAESFENRRTSFAELREFTRLVTHHYRSRGYATSRAYLPPQTVQDGAVTVKVIEGRIGKIHVEGNRHFGDAVYRDAIRLRRDRIFRYQDLETSLYFINSEPDRKVKAFLIPGADPGTSDIILKAEETAPFHGFYEFNNRGSALTHRGRHLASFAHGNLLGYGDAMRLALGTAEGGAFDGVAAGYAFPLAATDTTLTLESGFAETTAVKHLRDAGFENEFWNVTPGILQTVHRDPSFVAQIGAALEIKNSKTSSGAGEISDDRMRVLRVGPRFTFQDASSKTVLSANMCAGLGDLLDGSSDGDAGLSRAGAGGDFVYYTAGLARAQKIPFSSLLHLRADGQLAFERLTLLEQFRAGGATSVRGYPEADSSGDYGYTASAEVSVPFFFIPKTLKVPHRGQTWRDAVRLVGFLDAGQTFYEDTPPGGAEKERFLFGTGFGVRVHLDPTFSLQCDLGWPIGDTSADKNRRQTHVSVRAGF